MPSEAAQSLTTPGASHDVPSPAERDEANWFFLCCAILASMGMGIQSFNANYTAVTLLEQRVCKESGNEFALNCALRLGDELASDFAAACPLFSIFGSFIAMIFLDRLGRKRMMVLACLPYVLGWALTAFVPLPEDSHLDEQGLAKPTSSTVVLLFAGRMLLGLGGGMSVPGIGPWITECAPPALRGSFAALFQVLAVSGIGVMYLMGLAWRWRGIAVISGCACALYAVLLVLLLPESPRWLLAQRREAGALRALSALRSRSTDKPALLETIRQEMATEQQGDSFGGAGALLSIRAHRRALLLSLVLMTLQNLSGVNAVFLYLGELLQPVFPSPQTAKLATLPIAAGLIGCTLLAAMLTDRVGRVPLLALSSLGMAVTAAIFGVYFHLNDPTLGPLALGAIVGYFASFSLGVGPIPWILASELFPAHVRGTANSLATLVMFLGAVILTKLLVNMRQWMGLDGLFAFYSACCGLCTLVAVCCVVETKGKPVDQILRELCPGHDARCSDAQSTPSLCAG